FSRAATVSRRACTHLATSRRCKTTTTIHGLAIGVAGSHTAALRSGRLVVTFKRAASRVFLRVTSPFPSVRPILPTKLAHHKPQIKLTVAVLVKDASGTTTVLKLNPKTLVR